MAARVASEDDVARVTEIISASFHDDPVWGWAFPDPERRRGRHDIWWRFFIERALPFRRVWITAGGEAASVWLPPGAPELPAEDEARVQPLLIELVGAHADDVIEGLRRFDEAHPHDEPHHYLSLLGTHPDHRGHGFGMELLAENLALIDREHQPAYLESTNPANDARYAGLGFAVRGGFELPNGPTVTTMWRDAR